EQPASQPDRTSPANATSIDEIIKAIEPSKGFGQIQTAEFRRWGRRVFALWYCPFSGRGDCFLFAYYYDYPKEQWTRFIARLVPTGGDLSAEMPPGEELIVRDGDGKVAVKESVATFPRKIE
ncbi:MAG: hypothetical protein ABSC42_15675, partial [Tepidisphaeraceae bacterium]